MTLITASVLAAFKLFEVVLRVVHWQSFSCYAPVPIWMDLPRRHAIIILRGDWAAGECATGKDRIGKRVGSSSGAGAGACEGAADLAAGSRAPAQRVVLFCPRSRRGCGERAQGRTVADQKCEGAVTARFSATRCSLSHNLITNSSTQLLVPHDTTGRGSVFYPLPLCPIPLLYRWATLHTDTACNRLQSDPYRRTNALARRWACGWCGTEWCVYCETHGGKASPSNLHI
ncbi:hypothetical protein GGX14DRAFT_405855 [Mycena pura]|uniref:Secreted protein n=1 Tax=Mycena pura TaxID=153505 RepID=A0AAD6Y632_9AGAR|nr:hypothetical protein GGX14DRAFT_405855 [Mycena pura]